MRPMANEPSLSNRDEIHALVQSGSEMFFNRANNASLVVPTRLDRSIPPTIEQLDIGVVEYDLAIVGEMRKPRVYFLNGVLVKVTGINKQHVDSWLDTPLSAPISKDLGEQDVVRPDEGPARRFGAHSAAIVQVYADQESSRNPGNALQNKPAFAAAHAKFDDQPRLDCNCLRKYCREVIGDVTGHEGSTIRYLLKFRRRRWGSNHRPYPPVDG